MSAKAFFSNENTDVQLKVGRRNPITFEKVSAMVNYCNEKGIELLVSNCIVKDVRFSTIIRYNKTKVMPHIAYITDHLTGMKFSNSFDTKEQAKSWIEQSKKVLTQGRAL